MGFIDDILAKDSSSSTNPPSGVPLTNDAAASLKSAYEQKQQQQEEPVGILQGIKNFGKGAIKLWAWVIDWIGDKKDHWVDNEDEDMGITDWKKYKTYEQDLSYNRYTKAETEDKTRELYESWVLTDKYFTESQKQYDAQQKQYNSTIELQQKITRDLTAQMAPYMSKITDAQQRRVLQAAITTQADTFISYYSTITDWHDTFQKDKYLTELGTFMDSSKKFMSDYAERVVAWDGNYKAFLAAQEKNLDIVKEMDSWNTNLKSESLWASATGSAKDILDYDGFGETVLNVVGTVTGTIALASNALWNTFTNDKFSLTAGFNKVQDVTGIAKKNIFRYNSGFEELALDAIDNPNDGLIKSQSMKLFAGLGEIVDGSDSLATALIPMVFGGWAGLLTKTENAARLTSVAGIAKNLPTFWRTVGVSMLQDALVFDASFTSLQGRGLSESEMKENALFSLWTNALWVAFFAKPVLRWSRPFAEWMKTGVGMDSRAFARGEWFIEALNGWRGKQAGELLRQNMISDYKAGTDLAAESMSEADLYARLTPEGRKLYVKVIQKNDIGMKAVVDDPTSDTAFYWQKQYNKTESRKWLPTEEKLIKQEESERQFINESTSSPSLAGKITLTGLNNSTQTRTLITDAITRTQTDANVVFAAGSPFHVSDELKNSLLEQLFGMKALVLADLGDKEKYFMAKTFENLHDAVQELTNSNPQLLDTMKRDVDIRLPSEIKNTTNTPITKTPDYTSVDLQKPSILAPVLYPDYTRKGVDIDEGDKTVKYFLRNGEVPAFLAPFEKRMTKNFWDADSGILRIPEIREALQWVAWKTNVSAAEQDALRLYHMGELIEDFELIQWIELTREVSEQTLFQGHPFFKLFGVGTDATKLKVAITDPKDLTNAMGQLFMGKWIKDSLYDLPVMKYVLKDEEFKKALVQQFTDVTSQITGPNSGSEVYALVKHMFMRGKDLLSLSKHPAFQMEQYVDQFVKKNPVLEWARYDGWVKQIQTESPNIYQSAAQDLYHEISKLVDKNPAFLDKETLRFSLLAKAMDEVSDLHVILDQEQTYSYARSSVSDLLSKKKLLELEKGELLKLPSSSRYVPKKIKVAETSIDWPAKYVETIEEYEAWIAALADAWAISEVGSIDHTLTRLQEIDTDIALLNHEIKKSSNFKWPRENLTQVLEKLDVNPLKNLILSESTPMIDFESMRKSFARELITTDLNQKDFKDIVQFLSIPVRSLRKDSDARREYIAILSSLQTEWSRKLNNFVDWYIYEQFYKSTKNLEEVTDNVMDSIVRQEMQALDRIDLVTKRAKPSEVPSQAYIIVGRNEQITPWAPQTEVTSTIKWAGNIKYRTLFEMAVVTDETTPVFITANALDTLKKSYDRNPKFAIKDMQTVKKLGDRLKILDLDLTKTNTKTDPRILYMHRGYDDVRILSEAIAWDVNIFDTAAKEKLASKIKWLEEKYAITSITDPIDFSRAANIFDNIFDLWSTGSIWSDLKGKIDPKSKMSLIPFMQGKNFQAEYQSHVDKIFANSPEVSEYPWVLDAFTLTPDEYHKYSILYGIAKKTKLSFLENINNFSAQIRRSFLDKLIDEKSAPAQKYSTYKILSFLMNKWVTVPRMTRKELLSMVDGFAPETSAIIGRTIKDLMFNHATETKIYNNDVIAKWIKDIEEALKWEPSLDDLRGAWGLEWEMRFQDEVQEISDDKFDEVLTTEAEDVSDTYDTLTRELVDWDITEEGEMNIISARQKALKAGDKQLVTELEQRYPSIFATKAKEDEITLTLEQAQKETEDFKPYLASEWFWPRKLESVDNQIWLFQELWDVLQNEVVSATKKLYLWKNFVPYVNKVKDITQLIPSDFNSAMRRNFEKIDINTSMFFTDAKIFDADPSLIQKDENHNFFMWNGEKTIQLKSKAQTQDALMFAIGRAFKLWEHNRKEAFNMIVLPKTSPIRLNKEWFFELDGISFIDSHFQKWLRSYVTWNQFVTTSPLFRWAFSEDLATDTPLYNIIKRWATDKTYTTKLQETWKFSYKKGIDSDESFLKVKLHEKNLFDVTPNKAPDMVKAKIKASLATKYIWFWDWSTGMYRDQIAKQGKRFDPLSWKDVSENSFANTGKYSMWDAVFVSVNWAVSDENLKLTLEELQKAIDARSTIITDSEKYLSSSKYNKGEKKIADFLKSKKIPYRITDVSEDIWIWLPWAEPLRAVYNSVLSSYESFMWFKTKARLRENGNFIDELGEISPSQYQEVFEGYIPIWEIVSVRSIGYLPMGNVYDETWEIVRENVEAQKYMFEWDIDKPFHEFFSPDDTGFNNIIETTEVAPNQIFEVLTKDWKVRHYDMYEDGLDLDNPITKEEFASLGWDNNPQSLFSKSAGSKDIKEIGEVQWKKYSYMFDTKKSDPEIAPYHQVNGKVTNLETGDKFEFGSQELSDDYLRTYFKQQQELQDEMLDNIC